ncbi:MAG: UDP-galactopyranose mutase [Desulfobacula sp.]|nr:UDP-galactopyranose mutase [Desulfobacula sp.]
MKILVVGAGFAGATFARLAADDGIQVDIIDQRPHIGGNSYSYADEKTGIEIHKYGPHIFHTDNSRVFDFISRFTRLNGYVHRVKAKYQEQTFAFPINLDTINQFFNTHFSPVQARQFITKKQIRLKTVENFEDFMLQSIGRDLYEAFFKGYTIKQWGRHPSCVPISTAMRIPIRFNNDDICFFPDRYQGIPENGYQALFDRMLGHENIRILLGVAFKKFKRSIWRKDYNYLVYTGSIDEYFNRIYGELSYRSLRFEEIRDKGFIQDRAVINYCSQSIPYTRIHEHKHFTPDKKFSHTLAFREYPCDPRDQDGRYYPVESKENKMILKKYSQYANKEKNVIFIGRLGSFQYLNMDQVIGQAMLAYEQSKINKKS